MGKGENEIKTKLDFDDSIILYLREGLLGMHPKSHMG